MIIQPFFRVFPEGDVIALWDDGTASHPNYMTSYQSVGQHSDACRSLLHSLRHATKEESAPLISELRAIGYEV